MKFLKSLFGAKEGGGREPAAAQADSVEYKGYTIQPTPKNPGAGWSTEGIVSREIDGEVRTHHFIRADTSSDPDSAAQLMISKAQVMIDQVGDGIFDR